MENRIERLLIMPHESGDFTSQLKSILDQTKMGAKKEKSNILHMSFFIKAGNNDQYRDSKSTINKLLPAYLDYKPSVSIIAQAPANGNLLSLELVVMTNRNMIVTVQYKEFSGISYTLLKSGDCTELYAGGISADLFNAPFGDQVEEAYKILDELLLHENLTFSDIIRQWNYIEGILTIKNDNEEKTQNYQVLNDVRSKYYSKAEFKNGYPAATGIGMDSGGPILEIYAAKPKKLLVTIPVKNPRQTDAYHYSEKVLVGASENEKTTPKFERAKFCLANGMKNVFISGTASIQKEHTLGIGDVRMQTEITLDNISNLISPANLTSAGVPHTNCDIVYSFIRVYIKVPKDLHVVREICDTYYGNIPIHYLIADICRDNLLLEIEGVAEIKCI